MGNRILRMKDVVQVTRLSKATIYGAIKRGDFPAPVKLGPRAVGWTAESIDRWVNSLTSKAA